MPLPVPNTDWPIRPLADLMPHFRRWSAWYSGDVDQLCDAYGGTVIRQHLQQDLSLPPSVSSTASSRIIWGRQIPEGQADDRWHVPIASDLCSAVSELAYSDPPQITATTDEAQARVEQYIDSRLLATAAGGTEIGAALGGHYLQAVVPDDAEHAQLESIAYDGAWPVFSRGRLVSVAFWWELERSTDQQVWRHFESHELDAKGIGIIRHALYLGAPNNIGLRVALSRRPETAVLKGSAADEVITTTETPGLDVVHIPARSPQRLWRTHSLGMHLGRSIFQGIEGSMSKLDDAYTSWMRDLELGRSRLVIARYLLENNAGPGTGAGFDTDQRLFSPIELPPSVGVGAQIDPIRLVQFQIRMEEHRATCQEITEVILRSASFSAQTFGEDEQGNAQTATGVVSKDSRSMRTRRAMLADESVGLQRILRKMLAMDQAANNGPVADDLLDVSFPEGAEEQPLAVAQTVQALRVAEAASDETIVRRVNPGWDDPQVMEEVAKIQAARGAGALADPGARDTTTITGNAPDQPTGDPLPAFPGTGQ